MGEVVVEGEWLIQMGECKGKQGNKARSGGEAVKLRWRESLQPKQS